MIHARHTRWSQTGLCQKIFEVLEANADNEYAMMDSTLVRAHQYCAGAKKMARRTTIKMKIEDDPWVMNDRTLIAIDRINKFPGYECKIKKVN